MNDQRILIIGPPGSGKTTFSLKLSKLLGLPLHHLDQHLFLPGRIKRDPPELWAIQEKIVQENAWVIEGCGVTSLEKPI